MYPCVMNCKVIFLCDLCLQYATAQSGLVTDNVRYQIAHSSVCRRLQINVIYVTVRFVIIACRKNTCHKIVNNGAVVLIFAELEALHITKWEAKPCVTPF